MLLLIKDNAHDEKQVVFELIIVFPKQVEKSSG